MTGADGTDDLRASVEPGSEDSGPADLALPHAVALSWGVAEHPQRGPKRELSIERIVDAAVELADAEGLGAVSMARVAAALGFTTMSLYRYVTSKDDLLQLMQDAVTDIDVPEPPEHDWRAGLKTWTLLSMAAMRAHPWFTDIPVQSAPMMPNQLAFVDVGLRALRRTPLGDAEKMATVLLVASYARSAATIQNGVRAHGDRAAIAGAGAALAALVTAERFPDLAPVMASGAYLDNDGFDDFAYGLERTLDGVEHGIELAAARASSEVPAAASASPDPELAAYTSDKRVKEAAKSRREAEKSLREARKREREALKAAAERARRHT